MKSTLKLNRKTNPSISRRNVKQRDLRSEMERADREAFGVNRPGVNKDLVLLLARLFKNSAVLAKKRSLGLVKGRVTTHSGTPTLDSVNEQINQQQELLDDLNVPAGNG